MTKLIVVLILASSLIGCTSETQHGRCVGAFSDSKDPKKVYEVSGWNVFLGVVFFEMVVPPIMVILNQTHCPVGDKK